MGRLGAIAMREAVREDVALLWHLQSNHYPPIPAYMVPVCKRAIANARRGDWNRRVRLPEGVTHRRYGRLVPTFEVVEHAHLDSFID